MRPSLAPFGLFLVAIAVVIVGAIAAGAVADYIRAERLRALNLKPGAPRVQQPWYSNDCAEVAAACRARVRMEAVRSKQM